MSRWFAYFGHVVRVTVGFTAAMLGAALFVNVMAVGGMGPELLSQAHMQVGIAAGTLLLASLYGYLCFAPALALVAWSEWRGRADWLFHALAGGGLALVVFILRNGSAAGERFDSGMAAIGVAAGIVGATVYWLICGRNAGALITQIAEAPDKDQPVA